MSAQKEHQFNPSILSDEQLKVIAAALVPHIAKMLQPEKPMRQDKIAEHLDVTEQHIIKLAKNKVIEEHRFDDTGIPYYFASEVNEALKKRSRKRKQ